jgi:hypothetical protein
MPNKRVKTGLSELSIPASELVILVSARGNRNAGITLPNNPIIIIDSMLDLLRNRKCFSATGKRQTKVITILSAPTW